MAVLGLDLTSNMGSGTYQHHPERFHNLATGCSAPKFTAVVGMKLAPAWLKPALDTPITILPEFSHAHSAAASILCIRSGLVPQLWP